MSADNAQMSEEDRMAAEWAAALAESAPAGGYGMGARYMMPLPITPLLTRTKFRDYWALEFGTRW